MSDQYKLVNGELVAMTADEIAAHEEMQKNSVLPPQSMVDQGALANQRLDDGINAAQASMKASELAQGKRKAKEATSWQEGDAVLQAQIDAIRAAVTEMLMAQSGPTPRVN